VKRHPEFWHIPTGCYRQVLGSRITESGNVFVTITREDARERLFLVDTFDESCKVEMSALWEALRSKETARTKAKARKDKALENMRHARETEFETIAPEDSCGDPIEEEEFEEEEVEVED
jgi:hypothetical protein